MPVLCAEDITRKAGGKLIVDHVSFALREGECLALVGPSGAGKTTLLRALAGLDRPDQGRIVIGGEDCTMKPPAKRGIAMIFQEAALFPHTKVRDNILYGMHFEKDREQLEAKLYETARVLRITDLLDRYPFGLSGGETQRVGIARALIRDPSILLLDEPFSSLDVRLREELRDEVLRIAKERGMSLIAVTHDQREASLIGDRTAVMMDGRWIACNTPEALYHDPDNIETAAFFGDPGINLLREGDIVRGIRPEDIVPGDTAVTVTRCVMSAGKYLVTADLAGRSVVFESKARLEAGAETGIGWPEGKELLFDAKSGERIRK